MPSRTPASRPRATMRAVQQQSRMRLVASAVCMKERQASKAAEASGRSRGGSDAGRRGSPACAKQALHAAANMRGLARAQPLAVPRKHGSTGEMALLAKLAFSPRSSGGRPSRGSGKRSRRNVHAAQARYTARQLPNRCGMHHRTSSRHRTAEGSMPDTSSSRSPCSSSRCSD
jgi:hypothetical protein